MSTQYANAFKSAPDRSEWLKEQPTSDLVKLACHLKIKVPMHPGGDRPTVNRVKLIRSLAGF